MAATWPSAVKTFTTKNLGDTIDQTHVNALQDEITAVEQTLAAPDVDLVPASDGAHSLGSTLLYWLAIFVRTVTTRAMALIDNAGTGSHTYTISMQTTLSGNRSLSLAVPDAAATLQLTPVAVGFDATNFTASSGNWTVGSGDVTTFAYFRLGDLLFVDVVLQTTTVSATPTTLSILIPAGCTARQSAEVRACAFDNSSSVSTAVRVFVNNGDTKISIQLPTIGGTFQSSTDLTGVRFQIFFKAN